MIRKPTHPGNVFLEELTLWIAHQHEPANVIPFPLPEVKEG